MADETFRSSGEPPGAHCAVHPEQAASTICARCGNFMCDTCSEGRTQQSCPGCRVLTGVGSFPFDRESYSLDGVISYAWEHFKREWLMLSLSALVMMVVATGASFATQLLQVGGMAVDPIFGMILALVGQFISAVVQLLLSGGLALIVWDVFRNRTIDIARLFSQFQRLGTYTIAVVLTALVGIAAVLPMAIAAFVGMTLASSTSMEVGITVGVVLGLVAAVPAIWLGLPLVLFVFELAVAGESSPVQALKNAFQMAHGQRLSMLLFLLVYAVILVIGFFACCIGIVPATGLGQLLLLGLYLSLRNGSGLAPLQANS
jgi:uncharacterized membrane protein